MEKKLIQILEHYPVTPEELAPILQGVDNPWVKESLKLFTERFKLRQENFLAQVNKEINTEKSYWDRIGEFTSTFTGQEKPSGTIIKGLAIDQTKVEKFLILCEKEPKRLHFLKEKPHCIAILTRAIQLGHIERVENILKTLPTIDQEAFSEDFGLLQDYASSIGYGGLFASTLPASVKNFVLKNPEACCSKHLFSLLCLRALHEGQILDAIQLHQAAPSFPSTFDSRVKKLISNCSKEELIQIARSIAELKENLSTKDIELLDLIVKNIAPKLIHLKKYDLIRKIADLNINKLNERIKEALSMARARLLKF